MKNILFQIIATIIITVIWSFAIYFIFANDFKNFLSNKQLWDISVILGFIIASIMENKK